VIGCRADQAKAIDDLVVEADGTGSDLLERRKTDQEGEGARVYLSVEAIARV